MAPTNSAHVKATPRKKNRARKCKSQANAKIIHSPDDPELTRSVEHIKDVAVTEHLSHVVRDMESFIIADGNDIFIDEDGVRTIVKK